MSGTGWNAQVTLQIRNQNGSAMPGTQVEVTVRTRRVNSNGTSTWINSTLTGTVNESGDLVIETGPHQRSGTGRISQVRYVVAEVGVDGDDTWDGETPSVSISPP